MAAVDWPFTWALRLHNDMVRWLQPGPCDGEAWMLTLIVTEQYMEGLPGETSTLGLLPAAGEQRREGHSQPLCRPQPIPSLRRELHGLVPAERSLQLCLTNPFVTDLPPQAPVKTATAPEPWGVAQECWNWDTYDRYGLKRV